MSKVSRRRLRRSALCGLLLLITPLFGCNPQQDYLIWPTSARTGHTVAVLFNTEWDTFSDPGFALLDASIHNVVVQVGDPQGWTEAVTPRIVLAAAGPPLVVGT